MWNLVPQAPTKSCLDSKCIKFKPNYFKTTPSGPLDIHDHKAGIHKQPAKQRFLAISRLSRYCSLLSIFVRHKQKKSFYSDFAQAAVLFLSQFFCCVALRAAIINGNSQHAKICAESSILRYSSGWMFCIFRLQTWNSKYFFWWHLLNKVIGI